MAAPTQQLNNQGVYPGDKTFAFTGYNQFMSGWTSPPGRYAPVPTDTITQNSDVPFKPHNFDGSVNGRYFASHAELQAWHFQPGNPIVVTREMCESCQNQFQRGLAKNYGNNIYVGSPVGIHTFFPNGTHQRSSGEVHGVDANHHYWIMTHDSQRSETHLFTSLEPGRSARHSDGVWTESIVYNARWGTQYYHKRDLPEYAEYYPNKNTEMLVEDLNQHTIGITHVGSSNGAYDIRNDGSRSRIPPSERW